MLKSVWKPKEEIKYSMKDYKKISIISCGGCANVCDTGGQIGIKVVKDLMKEWSKEVVFARCIMFCCGEEIMRQALRINRRRIRKSDALVVVSCPAGVKAAYLCGPDIPVVGVLDPVGSIAITRQDNRVAQSICTACGNCVITYTDGICPVTECPSQAIYEPCEQAREAGTQCAENPAKDCIWIDIKKRGNWVALKDLKKLHETEGDNRIPTVVRKDSPEFWRKLMCWMAFCSRGCERIFRSMK